MSWFWLCKSFPIKSKVIYAIMDQTGLLGSWILVGNLALVILSFPFCFLFSLVRRRTKVGTKIWFVTKKGIVSCIPQVLTKSLLLFSFFLTILYIVQTLLGSKNLFFSFLFFCFSPIFDWLISFLFSCFSSIFDWLIFFLFLFFSLD